ncbi:MAG: helix-turn-helix domain-containing protein [Flavobacteriaceae bacterium]
MNPNNNLSTYKNIDKSSNVILNEIQEFSLISLDNPYNQTRKFVYDLDSGYVQIFFALNNKCTVAFNHEHCAIELDANQSALVYIPSPELKTLCKLSNQSHLYSLVVPINHFHKLLTDNISIPMKFDFSITNQSIIETQDISPSVKVVLHQFKGKKMEEHLKPLFIKGKVYELLSYYFNNEDHIDIEKCPFMANSDTVSKIKQAKDLVVEHMASPPSLEELAKAVGLNIKKLKIGFKEMYGMPVFTFLLNYKLDYAKNLLVEQGLSVSEVANLVGYSNSSHFIAAFKKKFNTTPKKYISQL